MEDPLDESDDEMEDFQERHGIKQVQVPIKAPEIRIKIFSWNPTFSFSKIKGAG